MNYSHSKLDVARKCMRHFKFQYIDKLKGTAEVDMSASNFGSTCHEIAERYMGGGKDELLALYHSLVPSKYIISDFYKPKLSLALKNIHEYWINALSHNVKEIKHESDISITLNEEISLNGKIDIVIEYVDSRIRIVDYKTNKSNEWANHTNQLSMYMLLLNKKYNISYENMDCEIIYLALDPVNKKGKVIPNTGYANISKIYKLEECDVEILKSEIESIHKVIEKSQAKNEWKAKPAKFSCTYCPYNDICKDKWTEEPIIDD